MDVPLHNIKKYVKIINRVNYIEMTKNNKSAFLSLYLRQI